MKRPVNVSRNKGIVLVVALIMLLAVTLIVVTSNNLVQTDLKIVSNLESRERARLFALGAIEEAISSDRFTKTGSMFEQDCGLNKKCFDIHGDFSPVDPDIVIQLDDAECVSVIPRKNSELDVSLFRSRLLATCHRVFIRCALNLSGNCALSQLIW